MDSSNTVDTYNFDALLSLSWKINRVRRYIFRQERNRVFFKQVSENPEINEEETGLGIINRDFMNKIFNKNTKYIISLLKDNDFCREDKSGNCILTWKFRALQLTNFNLLKNSSVNKKVFNVLNRFVWHNDFDKSAVEAFKKSLAFSDNKNNGNIVKVSDTEYWYRNGVNLIIFNFEKQPTNALLNLIDLKIQMILQERIQNYFHIISSFNIVSSEWIKEEERNKKFFKILENLLVFSWASFDFKECEVSIKAGGTISSLASGSMKIRFSPCGEPSVRYDRMENSFNPSKTEKFEFIVNDIPLSVSRVYDTESFVNIRMASRSSGNVNPRVNILIHRFIKLFIETIDKLIDVIMPIIHREAAFRDLKWKDFLDTLRLRAINHGENIHLIISDILNCFNYFYGISGVEIFSEDVEFFNMLNLFSRSDKRTKRYKVLEVPLTPAEILRRQLVVFPIRQIPGGRILIYFNIPGNGSKPLNPESPDQYLMGTYLWQVYQEEKLMLGIEDTKDLLFFTITECLAPNVKGLQINLNRRLPVRGEDESREDYIKLIKKVYERFSKPFSLFQVFSNNLESGLAYLRGRRDNLTGLYNRMQFKYFFNEMFGRPGYPMGMIFIDMDNFKIFNDAVSHDFGDKLLKSLANRLIESAEMFNDTAVPGRFGGDEFSFIIGGIDKEKFEKESVKVFNLIVKRPLKVSFFFDDRTESAAMEINIIGFFHRLLRPDIGSRQASRREYVEKPNLSPRQYIIDIWKHYLVLENKEIPQKIKTAEIVKYISDIIEDKILYNKIFKEIDSDFRRTIRLFIELQLKNYNTNSIRDYLIKEFGAFSLERDIALKVSAGISHNSENRLRSVEAMFKAADSRAYLAKQNGRNCMFGISGKKLT